MHQLCVFVNAVASKSIATDRHTPVLSRMAASGSGINMCRMAANESGIMM